MAQNGAPQCAAVTEKSAPSEYNTMIPPTHAKQRSLGDKNPQQNTSRLIRLNPPPPPPPVLNDLYSNF